MRIIGKCPAGLTLDDHFHIEQMRLESPRASSICFAALSQRPTGQGIWQLQSEDWFFSHVSCPGCTSQLDQENRVVFLLGHADKWRRCQMISRCLRLGKPWEEPQEPNPPKEEAIEDQNRGEYSEGGRRMEAALGELMQADARDLSL